MLRDKYYCAKLKLPSPCFKVLFYSGLEIKNILFSFYFYEEIRIFRMMKYKNRIRQLTKKYSYKELFLQVQELLSREDNLNGSKIKLNLFRRENMF